ncbi:MAG: 50S ribosomal protein L13 [Nitrososphaerota archaeon]|nr:50S ribosomal protein L13 [Candidatus Calditenuaceae archaeon]MDW8072752.1 50S ribosomal protein L13 [Nitrososphaerota archaeon]
MSQLTENVVVIDGSGHRLGRLASKIAKMLLLGKSVVVVNADKVLVTGTKEAVLERYLKLVRRTWYSSIEEPKVWYPRRADRIFWYTVARMLPRKKPSAREALRRLKVYTGIPSNLEGVTFTRIEDALHKSGISRSGRVVRTLTLGELSRLLRGGSA